MILEDVIVCADSKYPLNGILTIPESDHPVPAVFSASALALLSLVFPRAPLRARGRREGIPPAEAAFPRARVRPWRPGAAAPA